MSLEARMAAGAKAKGYFQQEVLSLLARRETKRNEERTLRAEWPGIGSIAGPAMEEEPESR